MDNVGIGTTTPDTLLTVSGTAGSLKIEDTFGGNPTLVLTPGSGESYTFRRNAIDGFLETIGAQTSFSGFSWQVNNGTEVMRINNAGNVGIGTSTPSTKLHVEGSTDGEVGIRNRNWSSGSGAYSILRLYNDTANPINLFLNSSGRSTDGGTNAATLRNDAGILHLQGSNSTGITIDTSGNVGIGTVSPGTLLQLTGANGAYIGIGHSNWPTKHYAEIGGVNSNGANNTAGRLTFSTNTADGVTMTERMRIDENGNVGIGTTSVTTKLDVSGGDNGSWGQMRVETTGNSAGLSFLSNTPDLTNGRNWQFQSNYTATGDFILMRSTAGGTASAPTTAVMAFDKSGNVGIGTSSPQDKLDIYGGSINVVGDTVGSFSTQNGLKLVFNKNSNLARVLSVETGVGAWHDLQIDGSTLALNAVSGGNVGIGTTTPQQILHVARNADSSLEIARFENASTGSSAESYITLGTTNANKGGYIGYGYTNNYLFLGMHGAVPTLSIKSGSVGIASTSPWRTLGVTGTVGFDGLTAGAGAGALCLSANREVTYSAGAGCTGSSQRFKHDIAPLDASSSLDTVLKFNPVSFVYNDDIGVKGPQVGLIAEQVQQVEPRLVATDASGTPFTVKYENLTAILASAIQKLFAQLSDLAATVASFADHFTTRELTFTRAEGGSMKLRELCLGSTCITETQLAALLSQSAAAGLANPSPTPIDPASAEPLPTDTSTSPAATESAQPVTEPTTPIADSPPLAPEEELGPTPATTTEAGTPAQSTSL